MVPDLVLDPRIRTWVFFPIALITFFTGIVRHYTSLCFNDPPVSDVETIRQTQIIARSRLLRQNGIYLPKTSYLMRKDAFNRGQTGYLTQEDESPRKPMVDTAFISSATDAVKGNFTVLLPAVAIGGWINVFLSGFVTTKIPFRLTHHFRSMLQRDIELQYLDPSWVSSASWYFLNVFGMRNLFSLVLGQDNAADENEHMDTQMMKPPNVMGNNDAKMVYRAEWEALEITKHEWALENVRLKSIL